MQYTLHQLRVFAAVVENKSLRKAAEQLFITPPAVTKQLQNLEDIIDLELFERKNNSLNLNNEGERFYDLVKPILEKIDQVNRLDLPILRNRKSKIRIGLLPIFEKSIFDAINRCIDNGTIFEYDLKVCKKARLIEKLENNDVDVVLAVMSDEDVHDLKNKGYNVKLYNRIDFKMYVSKKLLKRYSSLEAVFRKSVLILESKYRDKFRLSNVISFDCCLSVYNAIIQGVGYGFLPTFLVMSQEGKDLVNMDTELSLASLYSYYVYQTKESAKIDTIKNLFQVS
ncbi:LysR family transcriptional regulator [Francisella philomiragia]|uniref:Bacterial regulatory helix-turn-helix, lysR family protein n=1 Tax=Francisella philomiragia TaxID=28110 RepID=A0A0B6CXC3_9GAMM|nr:LysR family transcriptional regulator [Francisella philomiragia]AJI53480.1 bacterial regulatory helix-turn-helix, lysR family protein [Francisella philomiragia]